VSLDKSKTEEVPASLSDPPLRRYRREIAVAGVVTVLLGGYVASGFIYATENPQGEFFIAWNWYVALGLGLLATGGLSLYFYVVSQDIPNEIKHRVDVLVEQLQCPINGYNNVTNHIIEVCDSARSHYYAATLMPLIGAIGDSQYYKRYRKALTEKINDGLKVELVFLEAEPLQEFMSGALSGLPIAGERIELVRMFADEQLPMWAKSDEYHESFAMWRTDFIPYQVCIADGARAVLYFGKAVDLKQASSVRAFYTEDKSVIEVLSMGFEQVRDAAQAAV
jgi:hypothetical protein